MSPPAAIRAQVLQRAPCVPRYAMRFASISIMVCFPAMAPAIPSLAAYGVLSTCKCLHTGLWVGDCFIYNNSSWRLNYCVGGEVI